MVGFNAAAGLRDQAVRLIGVSAEVETAALTGMRLAFVFARDYSIISRLIPNSPPFLLFYCELPKNGYAGRALSSARVAAGTGSGGQATCSGWPNWAPHHGIHAIA